MKINDRCDGDMHRELPFNSFWIADFQDDMRTDRGDAESLALVRARIGDVRVPSRLVQP